MRHSIGAAVAFAALVATGALAQAGENDLGLKASGNGPGPGGVYKGPAQTTGQSFEAAKEADTRASKNPNSNNQDAGRVDTPTDTMIKPPQVLAPNQHQ